MGDGSVRSFAAGMSLNNWTYLMLPADGNTVSLDD